MGSAILPEQTTATVYGGRQQFVATPAAMGPDYAFVSYVPTAVIVYSFARNDFSTRFAAPATPPTGAWNAGWARDSKSIGVTTSAAGSQPQMYAWSGNGWGTKFANAVSWPTATPQCVGLEFMNGILFTLDQQYNINTIYLLAYAWSSDTGWGTKYADPSVGIGHPARDFVTHPSDLGVAGVGFNGTTYDQFAYGWSGSGWGTKYTSSTTTGGNRSDIVSVSPNGSHIFYGGRTGAASPYTSGVTSASWSAPAGLSNGTLTSSGYLSTTIEYSSVVVSNAGNYLAATLYDSAAGARIGTTHSWNGSTVGTKMADLSDSNAVAGSAYVSTAMFTPNDSAVIFALADSTANQLQAISWWSWSPSGWGTKQTTPSEFISSTQEIYYIRRNNR